MPTPLLDDPPRGPRPTVRSPWRRRGPKGISTLWLILTIPVLLVLFCSMVELANMWLARAELENALEATALAAVKEWGDANGGYTKPARLVGQAYARANLVRCRHLRISLNLDENPDEDNPNANLTCCVGKDPPTGNLIFGAITEDDPLYPITFNAGIPGGCMPAEVFINVEKEDSGADVDPRAFGIFFDGGPPNLSIVAVSFMMPTDLHPFAYFDSTKPPVVSIEPVGPDELNRYNPDPPNDVRGLDPTPTVLQSPPQNSLWHCPNEEGDVCFEFENPLGASEFQTMTIRFAPGTFTSTNDPDTTDFLRFGVSFNRLKPRPPRGDNNDGDAFGRLNVEVAVTFFNHTTLEHQTVWGHFVDVDEDGDGDFDDGRSEALILGLGRGLPAVRAQAEVCVPSLCGKICGLDFGSYSVSATATAVYSCATRRPRLIRVDRSICPGPNP
ncbi:MAG: TadE/TadG family type IV pilus assembly protein [Planctomycetota bacterium]|jgi:hypothetical protein